MRKLIYTIILIILIVTGIILVTGKIQSKKTTKKISIKMEQIEKIPFKLENMEGLEYKLYKIPEWPAKYLKTKSEFSSVYKHKKFVVYIKDENTPFAKEYAETLEKISNDSNYKKHYNFVSRKAKITIVTMQPKDIRLMKKHKKELPENVLTTAEGNAKLNFIKACGNFCIVNPSKNQIFALKGDSKKEAQKFEYILNKLKKW